MREIEVQKITDTLADMCIEANCKLNGDIMSALKKGRKSEENPLAEDILGNIIKNAEIAADEDMPICQDTGMAAVSYTHLDVYKRQGQYREYDNLRHRKRLRP